MNDDQFEDLKQFIDARISQSEARYDQKLEPLQVGLTQVQTGLGQVQVGLTQVQTGLGKVQTDLDDLRTEMHDGFAGVAEAIEDLNVRLDESYGSLDRRVTKLEQQAA